ncbi:autotransporter outer membrane beta-barrel domain-containing protein [Falsochrobactrum shanghaiense]|uniref:Autotransporter outer membrane beta-barrel domain-containing protein n=2 Tax=Falsochrobactrum shanghaiense TaxID=2201899 RepID=A0A316JAS2_9HYPH|nr:autotransporter outer membrane beta-barrel domain-containing protein [Falsochrobactrum shanghaiense]
MQLDARSTQEDSAHPILKRRNQAPSSRERAFLRLLRGGRMTKYKGEVASYAPCMGAVVLAVARLARASVLPAALLAGLMLYPAAAADRYWDANQTTPGYGGAGTWNLTSSLWSPNADGVSGPYTAWNDAALDTAIFGGTAGTVTLGSPISVGGLTFNVGGYTLNGSVLTLGGATPTIAANSGTTTINSVLAGASGFTKAGSGTLVLRGANTFTGNINLLAGTLDINGNAALGAAANRVITTHGTTFIASGALNAARIVELGSGSTKIAGSGVGSAHFTGIGGLQAFNGVTLDNDANDFTGQMTFFVNGTAFFTSVRNIGEASSLGQGIAANEPIKFTGADQYSDSLRYIGTGNSSNRNWEFASSGGTSGNNFINAGTGTLTLSGNINLNMPSIRPMTFSADSADFELLGEISGATGAPVTFAGKSGRIITLGSANSYSGTTTIRDHVTVQASVLADTGVNSSFGTGSSGGVQISNGGVLSYVGTGSSSNLDWSIKTNGSILNDGSGALDLSGNAVLSSEVVSGLRLGGDFTGTNTWSGNISGSGKLVGSGAGRWVLSGDNSGRTGAIEVLGGTLSAGSATAFGTVTGVTVNSGTLDMAGHDLMTPILSGTGGTIALGSGNLTVSTTVEQSFSGEISGTGSLIKAGTGKLILGGQNSYTGATQIGGGTLSLDFAADGAPASNIISANSALNLAGGELKVIGADGAANSQSFNGLNINAGSNRITATSGAGGSMNVSFGTISHTGGIVDFATPANGDFTTTNTALGGWATVNGADYAKVDGEVIRAFEEADYVDKDDAGSWRTGEVISDTGNAANTPFFGTVSSSQQLGGLKYTAAAASTVNIAAGQTLGIDGTIIVAASVGATGKTIAGGSLTGGAGGTTLGLLHNGTGTFNIASTIVDNGAGTGFVKGGSGLVSLSGANLYTGATTLSGGTLVIDTVANSGTASSIGAASADSANLLIESGTLRYEGATAQTDRGFTLINGGPSRSIDVVGGDANLTFSGIVTSPDDAGFTKLGAGKLTLANGNNDYIGVTTVSAGTLSINTLTDGGTASGIGAAGSDPANIVLAGGTLEYTGADASSDRSFTLQAGGGIGVADAAATLTMSGAAIGAGGLRKEGEGTLVLAGMNSYTGETTVRSGTLRAGSADAFGRQTDWIAVNTGATLDLGGFDIQTGALRDDQPGGGGEVFLGSKTLTIDGANGTFTGAITGTGGIIRSGNSTQVFSGCGNNYVDTTTLNGGTLSVDCLADGGEASGIGASGSDSANLVFSGGRLSYTGVSTSTDRGFTLASDGFIRIDDAATELEFSGDVVGGGRLRKEGSGVLILSGTNSYTNDTLISGGVVRAGSNQAFGTRAVSLSDTAGAVLDLNGLDNTIGFLSGGGTTGGNVTLGSATLTLNWGSGSGSFAGAISGSGDLIKDGGITQTFTGCASDYTGRTLINKGVLVVSCLADGGEASSIGASTADAGNLVINGGTLRYDGTGGSTDRRFTLGASGGNIFNASGTGAIDFTSAAPVTFTSPDTDQSLTLTGTNTADNTFSALLPNNSSGVTSLVKSGTGTWVLSNPASSYTGKTTISGGVLVVDKISNGGEASSIGASSLAASNLEIGNNSTLRYHGDGDTTDRLFTLAAGTTFIESSGTGALVFSNTAPITLRGNNTDRTIAIGGINTGFNTMGGTIADSGTGKTTLAKNGVGTWVLTGNNTYTGNTVINNGNLIIGNGGTTGNAGAGNVIVDAPTSTLSFNRSNTFDFTGTLSGPGSLAQIGSGTTVLTATGNSIGATSVDNGTLQVDGDLVTPTVAMNGTSTLTVNGTVETASGGTVDLTGDAGSGTINVNTGGVLRANGNLGAGDDTINLSGTLDTGAGSKLLLGTGNDTLALYDSANLSGGGIDAGTGEDTLKVDTMAGRTLDEANISNFESLVKSGAGTLTLTGAYDYSAGTRIEAGTLQIGTGAISASLGSGDVLNNGTLAFNLDNDYSFSGTISGSGGVNKLGTGMTVLTGDNSYAGATNIQAGTLLVNGDQSGATGLTTVAGGSTLGGMGVLGGNVTVENGAVIAPGDAGNAPGTLGVNGNLTLASGSSLVFNFGAANIVGGPLNDHLVVGGNLSLDGTLNVTQTVGGNLGPGIYRVISYDGTLTDNGLNVTSPDYSVQTSIANQVNLVNSAGLTLSYWDGEAGPHSDEIIDGGNGVWRAAGDRNWTDETGLYSAPFANGSFAIFAGSSGTVTVDNADGQVRATGMQFATGGYAIEGGGMELLGPVSTIRVGDGTAMSAGYVATIDSILFGNSRLQKTDLGTLVLGGVNSYSGGTMIDGGVVQVSADVNLGAAGGALSLGGGTLRNTAAMNSARATTLLAGGGTFDTLADLTLNGIIDGVDGLTKTGGATLTLTGTNSYGGGTAINGGTVAVSADQNLGQANGAVTFNGGTLNNTAGFMSSRNAVLNAAGGTFKTDGALLWYGSVDGAGALTKSGAGPLILAADNNYLGGTTIAGGLLQLGFGGPTGSILGDVVNNGALAFNRSDLVTFNGLVSGSGSLEQKGPGTLVLTADNSYTGQTRVSGGALYIHGDQSLATGGLTVAGGAAFGGVGTIGGNVTLDALATLNPGDLGITPGTLTINGHLAISPDATLAYNFGQAGVVGGAYNDLTVVHGNLDLAGTINVDEAAGGNFGPGIYRVISYDGTLTDGGLVSTSPDHAVQTAIANQVNLVSTSGLQLDYWDGADPLLHHNDAVNGGDGIWRLGGNPNWTGSTGDLNGIFDNGSYAVFAGRAGDVTVDESAGEISVAGMQFATDGYLVSGDSITLDGPQATLRVGDGTLPGADYIATIASELTGDSQLVKTDLGTLVLDGVNSYLGGTAINGGTVQISEDGNLGAASGALTFDGGALRNTAALSSTRDASLLADGGTFRTDAELTLSGLISGAGALTKSGNSALTLAGDNSYGGSTNVLAGGLFVNGEQSAARGITAVESGASLGGRGIIGGDVTIADGGTLAPGAADGTPGTLSILGNLSLGSGSILDYSFGAANEVGGSMNDLTVVGGNLVLDGTINVSVAPGGSFGPGVYRVFSYDGTLTNNGLSIGTVPSSDAFVQTSIANQVNLVSTDGLTLNYWDGDAGPKNNGVVDGGDGVWQSSIGNEHWTDSSGNLNAPYSDGSFAIFAGKAGRVSVDNSLGQVTASGMQFATDGYVIGGGDLDLTGSPTSTIRVGDGTTAGGGITATIDAALTGNTQLVKSDFGTLVLTGTNSYTGGTAVHGGALAISSDANLGEESGQVSLNGGTLHTMASFESARTLDVSGEASLRTDAGTLLRWNGFVSGGGNLQKSGGGRLNIASDSFAFAGSASVQEGVLEVSGSLCGEVSVLSGGRLEGNGTVCDTNNFEGGTIAPGVSIGMLTVDGDYRGQGGMLEIEAELGGDSSKADRLVVTGNTSGTSNVKVLNLGGGGAQTENGIKIIEVGGRSEGSFNLLGDYRFQGEQAVIGGAYAYRLYKNGVTTPADGDWYLRSSYLHPDDPQPQPQPQPLYAPGVPLYEAYTNVLQSFNEAGTLQQRAGNRSWGAAATPQGADMPGAGPVDSSAIWARIDGAHSSFTPERTTSGADYDTTVWKMQAGLDGMLHEGAAGVLIGGVTAHFGTVSSSVSSLFGIGSIDSTGYGFGGTLTWYGENGFYTDAQAQLTWFDSDIHSATLGRMLVEGNGGFGYALSMEAGQKIALQDGWSLTPQAQLAYSSVRFSRFTDSYGGQVSTDDGDRLLGRLGLAGNYEHQWVDGFGQLRRSSVYGIANLYYDFLNGSDVDVSGTGFTSRNQALWGGIGLGGTLSWDDGRYALYGEALAKTSLKDFGDSRSMGARLGFRVKW